LDGTTVTKSYTLHVETTSPVASATATRALDSGGWYVAPVSFSFTGSSFSGIASCTPATAYSGPGSTTATVSGSCTDNAGKTVTATSASFAYDASPPSIAITSAAGDGIATLHWSVGSDVAPLASVQVVRTPGATGHGSSVVSTSAGPAYQDRQVRNGVRYTYTIVATDQAGLTGTRTVVVVPGPHLLAPADGALAATPPLLAWTPVRRARYYNVQLLRGGRKILSAWPATPGLQLRREWRFGGRRYRLKPGRYEWYVWPGYGGRRAARYGRLIGSCAFVVPRS
jgi:hypothetical protein